MPSRWAHALLALPPTSGITSFRTIAMLLPRHLRKARTHEVKSICRIKILLIVFLLSCAVCPFTISGVVTQVEPSKMATSLEKPGHPTAGSGECHHTHIAIACG